LSQCDFVKQGFVVDAETLEIFNSHHCIKAIGHAGRHIFHKNPTMFHKTLGGAVTEQIAMIKKRKKMLKQISVHERKRDL
jgi:hypothetical protein